MRRPCGRGIVLALTLTLALALGRPVDLGPEALVDMNRFTLALVIMVIPGAFLAALPGRLRHRGEARAATSWRRCAAAFCGGLAVTLGGGLAGGGLLLMLLTGPAVGSLGGWAFLAVTVLVGLLVSRMVEGRRTP